MVNLRRRSSAVLLTCLATCLAPGAVVGASGGVGSDVGPTARIALPVQHTGSSPVSLPAAAAVGQSASFIVGIDTTSAGAAGDGVLSLTVGLTRSIAAVDSVDGSYTAVTTVGSVDIAQAPAGYDTGDLESIGGVAIQQSFAGSGTVVDIGTVDAAASPAQAHTARRLMEWLGVTALDFPTEPVAVGQSWMAQGSAGANGDVAMGVSLHCRLVELSDSSYTVELSYAQSFSEEGESGQVDGTVSGQGTLTGSLHNPLALEGALHQTIDGIATNEGVSTPWTVTSAITFQNTGGGG